MAPMVGITAEHFDAVDVISALGSVMILAHEHMVCAKGQADSGQVTDRCATICLALLKPSAMASISIWSHRSSAS